MHVGFTLLNFISINLNTWNEWKKLRYNKKLKNNEKDTIN
jgi:hypothetical protein